MGKVLLAETDQTVHVLFAAGAEPETDQFGRKLYAVSSLVLRAGDTVDAEMVPPYVLEKVEAGACDGLVLMSKDEAEATLKQAEKLRALANAPEHLYASGWDNSHSDHLVPDSLRMANLSNEGKADAEVNADDFVHSSGEAPPAVESGDEPTEVVEADPSADSADLAAVAVGDEAKEEAENAGSAEKLASSDAS